MSGDKDDWDLNTSLGQFTLKVESAGAGQPHIEHRATWYVGQFAIEELLAGRKCLGVKPNSQDKSLDRRTHRRIVVDHINNLLGFGHDLIIASRWKSEPKSRAWTFVLCCPNFSAMSFYDRSTYR